MADRDTTVRTISSMLKRVHAKHIFALEALIARYRAELDKIARSDAKPVAMVQRLSSVADSYILQAVAMGYRRGLSDLRDNGWLTRVGVSKGPADAPKSVVRSITLENERYLTTSLLPDLQAGMSDAARIARIQQYAHFLWKAAERAYVQAIKDFDAFLQAQNRKDKVREGGAGSGNFGHEGRPGEVGGSGSGGLTLNPKRFSEIEQHFIGHWIGSSSDQTAHYLQMAANEVAGKDRFDNLLTSYRTKADLQEDYDTEQAWVKAEDAQAFIRAKSEASAKQWDEKYPNGLDLHRGIGKIELDALSKTRVGQHVQFRPLMSTTDLKDVAASFGQGRIVFEGVVGKDVLESTRVEPIQSPIYSHNEFETILRGNSHDWILDRKEDGPGKWLHTTEPVFYFKAASMKEADRAGSIMVIHSDRGEDDFVSYKPRLKEGGVGSGNYGHSGRLGMRGGSASGGRSIVPTLVARAIERDGGITISTKGVRPRSGFAIAGIKNEDGSQVERIFNAPKVTPEEVEKFVNQNKAILDKPGFFIGGWVSDGKTYLDVSEIHEDKQTALDVAEKRDEIAIFDLGTNEEHFTREDHLRPSESKAQRAA